MKSYEKERGYVAMENAKRQKTGSQVRRIKKAAKGVKGDRVGYKALGAGSISDDVAYEVHVRKAAAKKAAFGSRKQHPATKEGDSNKPVGLQGAG
jgi:hypothetical protein